MSTEPALSPIDTNLPVTEPVVKQRFPWRLFFLLAALMFITSLIILPYAMQISAIGNPNVVNQVPQLVIGTIVQVVIFYFPILLLGLFISRKLGLGAPYLEAITERKPAPGGFRKALIYGVVVGLTLGVVLLLLAGATASLLPPELTKIDPSQIPNAFNGFLASISAGVNEEILLRLFVLALFAWLIQWVFKRKTAGRPNKAILWTANVLAAVLFGLAHMPNLMAMNVPITPITIGYIILLNGIGGLGFGWLFWTFGLEAAMIAHFSTDIVLHVIARLFAP